MRAGRAALARAKRIVDAECSRSRAPCNGTYTVIGLGRVSPRVMGHASSSVSGSLSRVACHLGARFVRASVRVPGFDPQFRGTVDPFPGRGWALLVSGVAEVHQFPDRIVLVGFDELGTAISGDPDVTDESQVRAVEMRQLRCDAFDSVDGVDHPSGREVVGAG